MMEKATRGGTKILLYEPCGRHAEGRFANELAKLSSPQTWFDCDHTRIMYNIIKLLFVE